MGSSKHVLTLTPQEDALVIQCLRIVEQVLAGDRAKVTETIMMLQQYHGSVDPIFKIRDLLHMLERTGS